MKQPILILAVLCTIVALAQASEPRNDVLPSSELVAIRARLDALEAVVARTGVDGENVELRAPSLHGSVSLVDGGGIKIVEIAHREGIPHDFSALGFFGHIPMGQDSIQGDWNLGAPDEANQCFLMGSLFDAIGTNTGFGLVLDARTNF